MLSFFPLAIVTYTASYTGWFVTKGGYMRNWADTAGVQTNYAWIPGVFRSWWHWHAVTLNYHNHLFSPHAYEAGPGKWIIMARPTQMYAVYPKCPSNPTVDCARDIVSLGNPIIWWTGVRRPAVVPVAVLHPLGLAGWCRSHGARGWVAAVVLQPPSYDVHDVRRHLRALHLPGSRGHTGLGHRPSTSIPDQTYGRCGSRR